MKKIICLIVVMAMVLSLQPFALAEEYETIACGETVLVDIEPGKYYYQFVAESDDYYAIWTFGAEDSVGECHLTLLDSNMGWIEYDMTTDALNDLEIVCQLQAGETYYLEITNVSSMQMTFRMRLDLANPAEEMVLKTEEYFGYPGYSTIIQEMFLPRPAIPEITSWESSDETVVDADWGKWGYIYLRNPGTAVVTATSASGLTAQCTVTVLEPPSIKCGEEITLNTYDEKSIKFVPEADGYYAFCSEELTFTVFDNNFEEIMDSDDCLYDVDGYYAAPYLTAGEIYYIKAWELSDKDVDYSLRVEEVAAPQSVIPHPAHRTTYVGCWGEITPSFYPEIAGMEDCVYSTEDRDIIKLEDYGSYETLSVGTAVINVTSDSGLTASVTIDVIEPPAEAVEYGQCGYDSIYYCTEDGVVTVIGTGELYLDAFACSSEVTKVILPEGITIIGKWAFDMCSNLKEIVIPQTVKYIGEGAFARCDQLKKIVFEGDPPEFGEGVFTGVSAEVSYPCDSTAWTAELRHSLGSSLTWESEEAEGVTMRGNIASAGDIGNTITIELRKEETVAYTFTTKEADYKLYNVLPGQYTLTVNKYGHHPRKYIIVIAQEDIEKNLNICPYGDVTGNGVVNIADVGRAYAYIKGSATVEDDYALSCLNQNGGAVNIVDVSLLYAHVKGTRELF